MTLSSPVADTAAGLRCPGCGRHYALGSAEYCEADGERLVPPPAAASAPSAAPVPPPAAAAPKPSLLSRVLVTMGLGGKSAAPQAATPPEPPPQDSPLPDALRAQGWRVVGLPQSDEVANHWPVQRKVGPAEGGQSAARFSRYLARVLTPPALYARLQGHHCPALPVLLHAGTTDLQGARAACELTQLPPQRRFVPLDAWLQQAPPAEPKALALLPHLVQLLTALQAAGVRPLSLSPAHLLRDEASGALCLTRLADLTDLSDPALVDTQDPTDSAPLPDYRPELECNALLSRLYAAPELWEQLVVSPQSPLYSVGQILAQATWGRPFELADLRAGLLPWAGLQDRRLARVLMGCCWPEPQGRWGLARLQTALTAPLEQLPPTPDWARLGPRAMARAFALGGATWWRAEDALAQAVLPQHWAESLSRLDALLDWLDASPWAGTASQLRDALRQGRSADWVLLRLTSTVCPDLPPTWRQLDLSDAQARQSLIHLAQGALHHRAAERELLDQLFAADLRGAFHPV